jgi:hypothetical protein
MPIVAAVLLATFAFGPTTSISANGCPVGYSPAESEGSAAAQASPVCVNNIHPETLQDIEAMGAQKFNAASAPSGIIPQGAYMSAVRQKLALLARGQDPENAHAWQSVGRGPLESADPGYSQVNTLGLADLGGRITSFYYVPRSDHYLPDTLLASVSYGGVWMTDSTASHWISIGDKLPIEVVGAVTYTSYKHTIIALTGDGSFGRYSREGAGAFYTSDSGEHWARATGIPDSAFGFRLAVDKAHPNQVYAATGDGLYQSRDGGRSFTNVKLPTGPCAGKSNRVKPCTLANIVTDVVVITPGGATKEKGGQVLAAVGWRGGNRKNPDGTVQSPNNGLYTSASGKPGTFTKIDPVGFPSQDRIGRVEFGEATGPDQDHHIVYAMVQDAVLVRNGLPGIDVEGADFDNRCESAKKQINGVLSQTPVGPIPYDLPPCHPPTAFNGVYVSTDFGQTWVLMADANELAVPGTGSALTPGEAALGGYGPGVQSWYNEWIEPDPTLTDPVYGAPTRLMFGLEEVWESATTNVPLIGPAAFRVIGRYFSGSNCISILQSGLPACPTNGTEALLNETTTHPDQHDAVVIPIPGGVQLIVGNDGGAFTQFAATGSDFNNANWGNGANTGFNTLLPYDAQAAHDGTIWMGMQDNGTGKIVDIKRNGRIIQRQRQIETKGGDGFFVGVDPNNGKTAYGEYVYGRIASTTDGGYTWSEMSPPITDGQFSTPFVLDPLDAKHIMIAGRQVVETGSGSGTSQADWAKVFDLGTAKHPGSATATSSVADPANAMSAIDMVGASAYVGYCGPCTVLDSPVPWHSGLATNVGGSKPAKKLSKQGWHFAAAHGLPNRYITGIAIDPQDAKTVYVTLGGYLTRWTPPGTLDKPHNTGGGHVYVSHNAGYSFTDISANMPNIPVNWIALRGHQLVLATDIGVFISTADRECYDSCAYQVLGRGLPAAPVATVRFTPGDPNLLTAASYGRGVWQYRFGPSPAWSPPKGPSLPKFLNKLLGSFDFESDEQGWTTASDSQESWRRMAPGNSSSEAFQVVPYLDKSSATLTSPRMKVPQKSLIKLQWDERRDTEPCCDALSVDWTVDGKVWHTTRAIPGQNPDFPNYTTVSVQFVVPAGNLVIRFRMTSDDLVSSPPYTGVAIDNVIIKR